MEWFNNQTIRAQNLVLSAFITLMETNNRLSESHNTFMGQPIKWISIVQSPTWIWLRTFLKQQLDQKFRLIEMQLHLQVPLLEILTPKLQNPTRRKILIAMVVIKAL